MPHLVKRSTPEVEDHLLLDQRESSLNSVARYLRANNANFQRLLEKVAPKVIRKKMVSRDTIPLEKLVAACLHYLANGERNELHLLRVANWLWPLHN